jgi:uncharacterized protein YfdQ (DUF2303 family)
MMKTENDRDLVVLAHALKTVLKIDLDPTNEEDADKLRNRARELSERPDSEETEAILGFLAARHPVEEPGQLDNRATCTLKRSTRQVPDHLNYMNRGKPYPRSPDNNKELEP